MSHKDSISRRHFLTLAGVAAAVPADPKPPEPRKVEVFRAAFKASGIDIERLAARAQQDDVKKELIDLTTDAVERGAFGSPTFFVGKEMFFGKDQLRDVEESILEQTASLARSA